MNYTFFQMPLEAAVYAARLCHETAAHISLCFVGLLGGITNTELQIYVNTFIEGLGDLGRAAGTLAQRSGWVYDISFR